MARDPLRCPSCGAMAQERPDPDGGVQCAFCGVRFSTHSGAQVSAPAARKPNFLLTLSLFLLLTAGAFGWWSNAQPGRGRAGPADPRALASASPGAEASGPLSATFAMHSRRPSVETSFMVYGEGTNTGAQSIRALEVVAILRDAKGSEVSTFSGYSLDDVIEPQASSPVRILVKDPPAHDHIDFEVYPRPVDYQRPEVAGLRVQANEPVDQSVFKRVSGLVYNEGDEAAKLVKITYIGRDASGKILGIGEAFAKDATIAAGSSSRWDGLASFGGAVASFEYRVSGWPLGEE